MRITNQSDWTVYWRLFNTTDTAHVVGLQDGLVGPGKTVTVTPIDPKVQIEFKWSNFVGSFLRRASKEHLYEDGHGFTITADYKLLIATPPRAPVPTFRAERVEQTYFGTTYKFYDLLAAPDSDVTQQVVLSMTEAHSTSHSTERSQSSNVSWGLSLTLAGGDEEGGSSGAGHWSSTVAEAFEEQFGATASTVRATQETMSFTARGGHLNVLQCHWNTDVEVGEATCGDERYEYRATLSVTPSIEFGTYAAEDVDSAPTELLQAWQRQSGRSSPPNG